MIIIPMRERTLKVGKVRVCRAETGFWYAEKRELMHEEDGWALSTHTVDAGPSHAEALKKALAWLPKKKEGIQWSTSS